MTNKKKKFELKSTIPSETHLKIFSVIGSKKVKSCLEKKIAQAQIFRHVLPGEGMGKCWVGEVLRSQRDKR